MLNRSINEESGELGPDKDDSWSGNQNNKQSNTKYNNSTESLCVVTVFLRAVHKINSNTRDIETASIVV
jgi:hypothetical protein